MKANKLLYGLAMTPALACGQSEKPNIIFVLCDDMGWGDLGCYGQQYISTPNLDRMAAEGMQFMQAYCGSPVSAPSRASLMTGQHSGHTKIRGNKEHWQGKLQQNMYGLKCSRPQATTLACSASGPAATRVAFPRPTSAE